MDERPVQPDGAGFGLEAEYRTQVFILLGAAGVVIALGTGAVATLVWWWH